MTDDADGRARMEGNELVIRVQISNLCHAAKASNYFNRCEEEGYHLEIYDEAVFAMSVMCALNEEQEDGTTPIHLMMDQAFQWVVEQGEEGISQRGIPNADR